ncbi:MAG: hypothetical protein AB1847_10345 [bacterium]
MDRSWLTLDRGDPGLNDISMPSWLREKGIGIKTKEKVIEQEIN